MGIFSNHNQEEVEQQPEVVEEASQPVAESCPECGGDGLASQFAVCSQCKGTGLLSEVVSEFEPGTMVLRRNQGAFVVDQNGKEQQV